MEPNQKSSHSKKEVGRWSTQEHQKFMAAIATYGKDWKKVEELVETRSGSQVRSHAQKFFNKLLKDESQNKKGSSHKKASEDDEQNDGEESSFMKFGHDDNSNNTPIEIVTLIRGESQKQGGMNIKKFQKTLQEKLAVINEENNDEHMLDTLNRQKSLKSMNNILQAYETVKEPGKNNQLQNESFLVGLAQGGSFENLIDFGNTAQIQQFEKQVRKRSFTLPEGVQGDDEDLNERKKRLITEQTSTKLTEEQKKSFSSKLKQLTQQNGNKNGSKPHQVEQNS